VPFGAATVTPLPVTGNCASDPEPGIAPAVIRNLLGGQLPLPSNHVIETSEPATVCANSLGAFAGAAQLPTDTMTSLDAELMAPLTTARIRT
jgi:hypothetical protein